MIAARILHGFACLPQACRADRTQMSPRETFGTIEEKMRKFHDLVSRIDKALAEPAVFIEDPAKAALLSSQRGELERVLVAAEDEWLRLAGDLDAARYGNQRGRPTKFSATIVRGFSRAPMQTEATATAKPEMRESWFLPEMSAFAGARLRLRPRAAPSASQARLARN
jgi:hypothetical protein